MFIFKWSIQCSFNFHISLWLRASFQIEIICISLLWILFLFYFLFLCFSQFIVCLDLAYGGFCFFQADVFCFSVVRFNDLFFHGYWIWVIVFLISRLSRNYPMFFSIFNVSFLLFKSLTHFRCILVYMCEVCMCEDLTHV